MGARASEHGELEAPRGRAVGLAQLPMNAGASRCGSAANLPAFFRGKVSRIFLRIAAAGFVVQWPWKIAS